MSSRPIPPRPSLEFDRKQAKLLLDALRRGDRDAAQRFRAHHPRFGPGGTERGAALHDAQLVVAREYGFASWPRWKQFVEARQLDTRERAAELVRAACDGDMRKASMLLDVQPDLERFDLYSACACGAAEHAAQLLTRDPSLAHRRGGPLDRAPILYACFSRFLRRDARRAAGIVRVVRLLLDHGADADAHYTTGAQGETRIQTALYGAAGIANNAELTRMLLAAGADADELAGDGEVGAATLGPEALYHASEFADLSCLRLRLEASSPPRPRRISYCLARMLDFENPAGVDLYLAHGADPNFRIPWLRDRTHLHRAIANGRSAAIIRRLLEAGGDPNVTDDRGLTPLRSALRHGRDDVAGLLREAGADVTQVIPDDASAATVDPDVLCAAASRNDVELMLRLLEAGADPNAPGGMDEMPPLHSACWRGHVSAARLLIARNANVHALNRYGSDALGTTLHGSVNCHDPLGGITMKLPEEITHGDYPAVADLLIAAGARLPQRTAGSEAVQDVLRRAGVPEPD